MWQGLCEDTASGMAPATMIHSLSLVKNRIYQGTEKKREAQSDEVLSFA